MCKAAVWFALALVCACAAPKTNVVDMGDGTYLATSAGSTFSSREDAEERATDQAVKTCAALGKKAVFESTNSTTMQAAVVFRCD
jgi:hypothetical protein